MVVKVINRSANALPQYSTFAAAGMDVRAQIESPITIGPLERVAVPTGLYMEIPVGFEVQVRPRSGLAAKHGITVLNSPGTIDADYRGELKVILVNLSNEPFTIERLCQRRRRIWQHGCKITRGRVSRRGFRRMLLP